MAGRDFLVGLLIHHHSSPSGWSRRQCSTIVAKTTATAWS